MLLKAVQRSQAKLWLGRFPSGSSRFEAPPHICNVYTPKSPLPCLEDSHEDLHNSMTFSLEALREDVRKQVEPKPNNYKGSAAADKP